MIVLLALLALVLLLLFVPLRYQAYVSSAKAVADFRISWLLRLIDIRYMYDNNKLRAAVRFAGFRIKNQKRKAFKKVKTIKKSSAKAPSKKKEKAGLPGRFNSLAALLTDKDGKTIIGVCFRYIAKTLNALKPRYLRVDAVFGFDDPSVTGCLLGAYEAAAGYFRFRENIRLSGDFEKPAFKIEASVKGSVSAASLVGPLVWLVTRKPVFQLIRQTLGNNKSERQEDANNEQRKREP